MFWKPGTEKKKDSEKEVISSSSSSLPVPQQLSQAVLGMKFMRKRSLQEDSKTSKYCFYA